MSAAVAPAKDHGSENFPVASLLLAKGVRGAVLAFYRFVRAADDVADAPDLSASAKLDRLAALEAALLTGHPAVPVASALAAVDRRHGVGVAEARLMLEAFRQDATRRRYADWEDLLAYCRRSADPVGRFMLRLHGEGPAAEPASDALCTALQILNHLQDLEPDRARLDRIYLPLPWLEPAGGEAGFFAPAAAAARRPVLDAALDQVESLIENAALLPRLLRNRHLAAQAEATLATARALARRLRRHDPLQARVALGRGDIARAVGTALVQAATGRLGRDDAAITRAIVRRSRSSFRLGMACLTAERRRAIHAVYAFCRHVDDLADGAAPVAERRRFIQAWHDELDRLAGEPRTPLGRELALAVRRFDLPQVELRRLLEGMLTDAADRVRLADEAALAAYCRAVAGTVGLLAVRIFGSADADGFALQLAQALQLVNILRDVEEDAARERIYLPLKRLAAAGVPDGPAAAVIAHRQFGQAWLSLAADAEAAFAAAEAALARLDRRPLLPAVLMLQSYRPLLARLQRQGWRRGGERVRLGRAERLRLGLMLVRGAA